MIKLRRMDGALSTHGRENTYLVFVGTPKALDDSDVKRMIILNWSGLGRVDLIHLFRDRNQCRALGNIVLSLPIP